MRITKWACAVIVGCTLAMPKVEAQWAVIDVASIKQLLVQINYWKQQVAGMQNQLNQLKQTHAALTGGRGMERLLVTSDAQRNYLPKDWNEMLKVMDGTSGSYGNLSSAVDNAGRARTVLDDARLAKLSPTERDSVLAARKSSAASAVMAQQAFSNAGQRFAALQGLVTAIGNAPDAKAIADLEARIAAEQAMLDNEQAKLATLQQAAQAEQWAQAAQLREAAIAGHGEFASRLHPEMPR
jgi:type IV secretion system protein VirB5